MKTALEISLEIVGPLPVPGQRKWAAGLGKQDLIIKAMQAYADQQVKSEREKALQDAIDSVIGMRDRSFNEDYIDAYELVINQLKSLKIKQP